MNLQRWKEHNGICIGESVIDEAAKQKSHETHLLISGNVPSWLDSTAGSLNLSVSDKRLQPLFGKAYNERC